MTQCVPSWDLNDVNNPTPLKLAFCPPSNSSNSFAPDVPSLDYEVAELTWENGQLSMYGLGTPRQLAKPAATTWDKPRAADTLECIVNQATATANTNNNSKPAAANNTVPWLDPRRAKVKPAASSAMDALVPCRINNEDSQMENSATHVLGSVPVTGTCMAGSCSGAATSVGCRARGGRGCSKSYASVSESATFGGGETSRQVTLDSSDREIGGGGLTSTSLWSPENTSSGKENSKTSAEDSVCHGRSQRQAGDKGNRKGIGKTSVSAKSRAAVHNQSERRRRDKINQRMKTLQKLVPNSSKADKASMLDEVIEYLKQLQAQIQMMSRMNMPSMMMPMSMPMQQHLQMSMMPPPIAMAMGGMGMGMGVMDINAMGRAAGMMPPPPAASFMPPPWDIPTGGGDRMQFPQLTPDLMSTFLACQQSQPATSTMDAYSRLAAMYQQFQQSSAASAPKN